MVGVSIEQNTMAEMFSVDYVFNLLAGIWRGEGRGGYPTIASFDYVESLVFERRDENSLFYVQRTEKRLDEQTELVASHWESGFIHALPTGQLELANVQIGGRSELLTGDIHHIKQIVKLEFGSESIANDERMVASTRALEIEGDVLRYVMCMRTTRTNALIQHLTATLTRSH
jgi:hypothetical protein